MPDRGLPEDGTLEREIADAWQEARDHWRGWRREAVEAYAFYAGHQWDREALEYLKSMNRPAVTFNRVAPLIDAVVGHENNNRAEVRYIPRSMGDAAVNEMLTNASDYFRDKCDAKHHESYAFRDTLICGVGWTMTGLSDLDNEDYDLVCPRIDPLEMLPDPRSREPNFGDARYVLREKRMTRAEIKTLWPDHDPGDREPEWAAGADDAGSASLTDRNAYDDRSESRVERKGFLVLEYWSRETEVFYVVTRPDTGETVEIDSEAYEEQKDDIKKLGMSCVMKRRTTWRRAFQIGNEIVQDDSPSPRHCAYQAITGKLDANAGTWFGICRALIDPQRWANKWLSQMIHIINSNSQGGMMLEKSAVESIAEFEERWTDPSGIVWLQDGAISKKTFAPKPPPTYPAGVERLFQIAETAFMHVSGVNAELLGLADRQQAGVLEWQRKQSAVTMLAPLFDSLSRFRLRQGRTWLYYMTTFMADGRLVRIVSDDGKTGWVPFNPDTLEYDVVVDQSATAPNQKEQTWGVLQSLLPMLSKVLPPEALMVFLPYTPLPDSLNTKLMEHMAQAKQKPPPPDPKMMEAQASIQADQAKLQAQLQMQAQKQRADMQLQQEKAAADLQIERERIAGQMALKREQVNLEAMLDREKTLLSHQAVTQRAEMEVGAIGQAEAVKADAEIARENEARAFLAEQMAEFRAANDQSMQGIATILAAVQQGQQQLAAVVRDQGDMLGADIIIDKDEKGRKRASRQPRRRPEQQPQM